MFSVGQNNEFRKGRRISLGHGIGSIIQHFENADQEAKKAYRTAQVQKLFFDCAKEIYGDTAFLVLQHINAIYIITEKDRGQLKKALPDAKTIKRLVIYTNDSMVYADLDSRQEIIKL